MLPLSPTAAWAADPGGSFKGWEDEETDGVAPRVERLFTSTLGKDAGRAPPAAGMMISGVGGKTSLASPADQLNVKSPALAPLVPHPGRKERALARSGSPVEKAGRLGGGFSPGRPVLVAAPKNNVTVSFDEINQQGSFMADPANRAVGRRQEERSPAGPAGARPAAGRLATSDARRMAARARSPFLAGNLAPVHPPTLPYPQRPWPLFL